MQARVLRVHLVWGNLEVMTFSESLLQRVLELLRVHVLVA